MKINQYISIEDLEKLTADEYTLFRSVLRSMGYNVDDRYGLLNKFHKCKGVGNLAIVLDRDGDLVWSCLGHSRFHYSEIMSLVAMGMLM